MIKGTADQRLACKCVLNRNEGKEKLKDISTNLSKDIICEVDGDLNDASISITSEESKSDLDETETIATPTDSIPPKVSPSPISHIHNESTPQYHFQTGSVNKVPFSMKTPTSDILVHKLQLRNLEAKAEKCDSLIKTLSRANYKGTHQSNTMLGFAKQ